MKRIKFIKLTIIAVVLAFGFIGFSFNRKAEMQTTKPTKTPKKVVDATSEITGFKNWTKVNKDPKIIDGASASECVFLIVEDKDEKNPHDDKFINVYVNDIGKEEMTTKKFPKFPVGTVIVKEKLPIAHTIEPAELLTVMIKRKKDYNRKVGDWEFLTFNGTGTETTSRGKLENCQSCHIENKSTDYVSRAEYLTDEIKRKLK